MREQFEAERATADYALVLVDPDIDVVHIGTPNALHFPMARVALSAGSTAVSMRPWAGWDSRKKWHAPLCS